MSARISNMEGDSEVYSEAPVKSSSKDSTPVEKIITHKIEKVKLRKAPNRWIRVNERYDDDDDELFRKFQGILNKITPQNFKNLAEQARDLEINTEERLKGCVDRILANAYHGPRYSVAYAHLCRVLSVIKVNVIKVDTSAQETVRETTFRRVLLTKVQEEFEKYTALEKTTPENEHLMEAELKNWECRTHKISLAHFQFLGELFKLKMLCDSIMHGCIVRLLRSTSDNDALEYFCVLITVTGRKLDHPQSKVRMDRYFERIDEIIEKRKISSRIKFMLQDAQELRKNDWIPRRKQEMLMTIDQIHHEAKMEDLKEKQMIRACELRHQKASSKYEKEDIPSFPLREDDYEIRLSGYKDLIVHERSTERLFYIFQDIIDKLNSHNFKQSAECAIKLEINTEERLKGCIDKIFLKALKEPNNSVLYAHLCRVLSTVKVIVIEVDDNGRKTLGETNFRRELISRIQKKFENDKRDDEIKEEKIKALKEASPEEKHFKEAELREWEEKIHKMSLGNMRFIGELFKMKMLSESVMHECIVRLLRSTTDNDALECFCVLITVTGGELDHPQTNVRIDRYFERIDEIIEKSKISSRIKIMLQDVKELRENRWILAKTIKEDHTSIKRNDSTDTVADGFLDPSHLNDLTHLFGSQNYTNDDIMKWIEEHISKEELQTNNFIKTLARAVVNGSSTGKGISHLFNDENFCSRLTLLMKLVNTNEEMQEIILEGIQVGVTLLDHPPGLIHKILHLLYDVEVVSESAFNSWYRTGKEKFGRTCILQASKRFFTWLHSAETESDDEILQS